MQLKLVGRKVTFIGDKVIGFSKDNLYDTLTCNVDTDSQWTYVLDVVSKQDGCETTFNNIIDLTRIGNDVAVLLEEGMMPAGKVSIQFRGTKGQQVYVSEIVDIWVKKSLNPDGAYDPVPSEFTQIEQRIQEINHHPPYPGVNGYWMIWNTTTHQYEESTIPVVSAGNFDELINRPKYNNATMTHTTNIPEVKTAVWDAKQAALVSGANIKTINNQSVLGSGNLQIDGGVTNVTQNGTSILDGTVAKIILQTGLGSDSNNAATTTAIRAFVNSSIESVAAYYITADANGNAFATKAALDSGPWYYAGSTRTPTRNDYAIVIADETHTGQTARYTYTENQWAFQYTFNMTFTAAQLAAINSGITAAKVGNYDTHIASTNNPHSVTKTQVGLGNVDNVKQYSASNPPPYPVTSVNTKTGAVSLTYTDVGADASGAASAVQGNLNTHTGNTNNPHSVTKTQVGLGSVVNTGDSDTPVSGGTTKFTTGGAFTALAKKQDNLPTVVNDRYLHTNSSTGELEWSTVAAPVWGAITGTLSSQTDLQTALDGKQPSLPAVTNDRYLHTNASTGALEWSEVQSGGGTWGSITGTLSNQTDLQTALNAKQNTITIEILEAGDT